MNGSVWAIFSVLAQVFAGPFVGAAEPVSLPLPQDQDYSIYLRSQLLATSFSTDPLSISPRIAAEQGAGTLEAFIINYEPCLVENDAVAYRLVVRNTGDLPVPAVTATFRYPAGVLQYQESHAIPETPVIPNAAAGTVDWAIGTVLPDHGHWHELNITFTVVAPVPGLTTELTVGGGGNIVLTNHTIPNSCPGEPTVNQQPLPEGKQPAIICDPGEIGCEEQLPNLGPNFQQAAQNISRQPVICSSHDPDVCIPHVPDLGPRFTEAVASILPGECSVLEDTIVAQPAFHDALHRRTDVAAFFMRPLYDSGQDFVRLVHENDLLGISHLSSVRSTLKSTLERNQEEYATLVQRVLDRATTPEQARQEFNGLATVWLRRLSDHHQALRTEYDALQTQRRNKFDPTGRRAVQQAITAIERACAPPSDPPDDGGLQILLFGNPTQPQQPYVKQQYEQSLSARATAYADTQQDSIQAYRDELNGRYKPAFEAALKAFERGDTGPLQHHLALVQGSVRQLQAMVLAPYEAHKRGDRAADDRIRLTQWEVALDSPKTEAAACARDTSLAARVEVSWCESAEYPEHIIAESQTFLKNRQRQAAVPVEIGGGGSATIDVQRTVGVSCGGRPGDPFWAADCSCNCNQLVPGGVGNIKFCQARQQLQQPGTGTPPVHTVFTAQAPSIFESLGLPIDFVPLPGPGDNAPPANQGPALSPPKPIVRHDMFTVAKTPPGERSECLHELNLQPSDDHLSVEFGQ